ncbi:uncharacterized protein EAE98_012345 [Botrytis deweyae]|uniref:Uncharacterized protein n=1 Tax=Botrytis deweyae TaxID=2478750 RepID=A0ABQ7I396_9HELO|nr:uncharacterized protein EAE98_012345 [Botrytis deweyae]KAF7909040.1 hypothetical protein EAE98_012345 [Botrytis deweyae]
MTRAASIGNDKSHCTCPEMPFEVVGCPFIWHRYINSTRFTASEIPETSENFLKCSNAQFGKFKKERKNDWVAQKTTEAEKLASKAAASRMQLPNPNTTLLTNQISSKPN